MTRTDFSEINGWVFDLDNTLYTAESRFFDQFTTRMTDFMCQSLATEDRQIAQAEQKRLFKTYGTTLRGLMEEQQITPSDFLDFVHEIDLSLLQPDAELKKQIQQLEGRKIIFTNGSEQHATNVLAQLELASEFDEIFAIEQAGYVPKPNIEPYHKLLKSLSLTPTRCCMFEDMQINLQPAYQLGMMTVWLENDAFADTHEIEQDAAFVHHSISDLTSWLKSINAKKQS